MPELGVSLRLRSVTVPATCAIEFCGPGCLLHRFEEFQFALPGGMGAEARGRLTADNLLFETAANTLIKHRKHRESEDGMFFGVPFHFDGERQRQAWETLRRLRPPFVSIPGGECRCSYEVSLHPGVILVPPLSPHTRHLAQKYRVRLIRSATEAVDFLRCAWAVLRQLNGLGIQHGDPSFYNFLSAGAGQVLIDVDDLMIGEEGWDVGIFLLHTFVPIAGSYLDATEMAAFARELLGSRFPFASTGIFQLVAASLVDGLRTTIALRTREIDDQAARLFARSVSDAKDGAVKAKDTVMKAKDDEVKAKNAELKAKDDQVRAKDDEVKAKNAELKALDDQVKAKEVEIANLAAVAAERLSSLEAAHQELRVQTEAAQQRLKALEATDRELRAERQRFR